MNTLRRLPAAALLSLSALTLAACGADEGDPDTAPVDISPDDSTVDDDPTVESPTDTATGASPTPSPSATTQDSTASGTGTGVGAPAEAALAAIATAEQAAGGTAYELDDSDDDGTWEVDVAVGDRTIEVTVNPDGTQVVGTEDDDDLDDEDRRALEAATITLTDAITTALEQADGTLDDVELDEEDGTFRWEVSVDSEGADDTEVYVDVATGEVLSTDR